MCLGFPGRVISIDGLAATVDFFGTIKICRLDMMDVPVQPGDYILNHVGYAIRKIPQDEIEGTLAMYDELLNGKPEDLMRQDIESEVGAAGARAR